MEKDADVDKLWYWLFHEENKLTSRLVAFLTAHGLLLTAMILATREGSSQNTTLLFSAIGVPLGVMWLFESTRAARNVDVLVKALKHYNTTYDKFSEKMWDSWLGRSKIYRTMLIQLLSGMAILGWGLLFVHQGLLVIIKYLCYFLDSFGISSCWLR